MSSIWATKADDSGWKDPLLVGNRSVPRKLPCVTIAPPIASQPVDAWQDKSVLSSRLCQILISKRCRRDHSHTSQHIANFLRLDRYPHFAKGAEWLSNDSVCVSALRFDSVRCLHALAVRLELCFLKLLLCFRHQERTISQGTAAHWLFLLSESVNPAWVALAKKNPLSSKFLCSVGTSAARLDLFSQAKCVELPSWEPLIRHLCQHAVEGANEVAGWSALPWNQVGLLSTCKMQSGVYRNMTVTAIEC